MKITGFDLIVFLCGQYFSFTDIYMSSRATTVQLSLNWPDRILEHLVGIQKIYSLTYGNPELEEKMS